LKESFDGISIASSTVCRQGFAAFRLRFGAGGPDDQEILIGASPPYS
jgi:hypothetical protein